MKPEIVVNGRFLTHRITGVQRYAGEILARLDDRVSIIGSRQNGHGLSGHSWEQFILPWHLTSSSILWSPANTGPLAVPNQILTLHDLGPIEHPEWFRPDFARWYRLLLPLLVHRVRLVVTSSDYSRRKILARFHLPAERVVVIPGGVDRTRFKPWNDHPDQSSYILFVGSLEPRKNLEVLLNAWKMIEAKCPHVSLLIVGESGEVFRSSQPSREVGRVRFFGYATENELPDLYARSAMFVLPSLDEGFGLPVLEAMACGTPVVASNRGSLPEVVGDAGLLFDPQDHAGLAAMMLGLLTDPETRTSLREKGLERARLFSWTTAAEKMSEVLQINDAG
jgi:glycosyltransferase involved in cell wall biosynthesis